ncbi:MAG: arylsulfatase [Mariniphaga sp.]|nr:arylsulfatase [Mariniphaga sp.]
MKKIILTAVTATILLSCTNNRQSSVNSQQSKKPNIVLIYFDDLGYGDVGIYGATALKTPNLDKLAQNGIRFTSGYASSATCTPSRYALLTGEYPWRNKSAKILPGSAPLIIDTLKVTLPKMLKEQGYHTGITGKWHLGLGVGNVDWNRRVSPGPNEVGFDYAFIMAATQDRTPTVYLENGNVVGLTPEDPLEVNYEKNFEDEPTGLENPELCKMMWHHGHNNSIHNDIPRIGFQRGGKSALWIDEEMSDTFLGKAQQYIKKHKDQPFFLYYALQQPHVPRTPHPRFAGSSGLGPRGDAIIEADWCVGELMETLEQEGLLENTLVILSSDNGPVVNDGYYDEAVEKLGEHKPWGPLRGGKYSLFEAGTRIPFITYWKGKIEPSVSDVMVSQIDLYASLAALTGSERKAPDSQDLLEVFLGKSQEGRKELIIEATSRTALRKENWALIPPYKGPAINNNVNIELGNSEKYLLFNLDKDINQQDNLAETEPEKLKEMIETFEKIRGIDFQEIEQLELK